MDQKLNKIVRQQKILSFFLRDPFSIIFLLKPIVLEVANKILISLILDCFQHSPEFNAIKPTSDYELKLVSNV